MTRNKMFLLPVSSGLSHTLLLSEEGQVYSCGNNDVGQLGHSKITRMPGEFYRISLGQALS